MKQEEHEDAIRTHPCKTEDDNRFCASDEEHKIGQEKNKDGTSAALGTTQRRTMAALCILYAVSQLAYDIHASFFPSEACSFGANETEVGIMFGVFSASALICSFFAGMCEKLDT
mmetsp:Transcript_31288/g.82058  ORF Transcript_31288/g.82058 Transcript_31288/m.82058 type:complete len:115 (-) Transcript_31288:466-810(-)